MADTKKIISAGKFKAECLQLMDFVHDTHQSIIITKHKKPVARLAPIEDTPIDIFGCMKDTVTIQADIIEPIDVKWEINE